MYLHIGGEKVLAEEDVVGIFDFDIASPGGDTLNFLKKAEQEGKTFQTMEEAIPRSFVLAADRVYLTPATTALLSRR